MLCLIINAMESPLLTSQQFTVILPVGLVIIFAVLVFAFGFKSSVEPPSFKHISYSTDERKNSKKKKVKDKKSHTNGHATVVVESSDAKKIESNKPLKQSNKVETPKQKKNADAEKIQDKKQEIQKSPVKKDKKAGKENVEAKNKKNAQNAANEKPADFDEGEWEIAPSRKDKKSKKKDDQDILPPYSVDKTSKKKTTQGAKKEGSGNVDKVTVLETKPMEILKIEDILPSKQDFVVTAVPPPVATEPAPVVPSVAPTADATALKKKSEIPKLSVSEEEVAPVAAVAAAAASTPSKPVGVETEGESPQVFNELDDTWKEAPQKKSKKKVRKD